MTSLHRIIIEKNIKLPRIVTIRWLLLKYELSEKNIKEDENDDISIRLASKEDIDFLNSIEAKNVVGRHVLSQDVRFWYREGFRCLYAGTLKGENEPSVIEYVFEEADNHRLHNMKYGGMYEALSSKVVHNEGTYVRSDRRGNNIAFKFRQKLNKILYKNGKKWVRMHIPTDKDKIASFKSLRKTGFIPDHWITLVKIDLPIIRTMNNVFIHHKIREKEFKEFPLSIYY